MTRHRLSSLAFVTLLMPAAVLVAQSESPEPTPKASSALLTALWFAHQNASPQALTPDKDRQLKIKLASMLGTSPGLPWEAASNFFDKATFQAIAGEGTMITLDKMEHLIRDRTPQSRKDMHAKTRLHADLLTTQFDMIEEAHHKPGEELVAWITKNYQPGKRLGVIVMCTGNTRRSVLGATMGNIAAGYYGLTDLRFYSGGTEPDAINPRTIATLKEIGVEIEPTGREAPRGKAGTANPIYRVRWGKGLETQEFSKNYTDATNPQDGFAVILVCSEADAACPKVPGASARIPLPYLDPKAFDGAAFEAGKYAERRDDEGRLMLSVVMQARRQLELNGKLK